MAKLTGIDIYKLLPRTNCGDCNRPTCMAFAMQVAAKKATLDQCPHVSAEAQAVLGDAQRPPIHTVGIGSEAHALAIGGETVLFRHEEKFHHPTAVAVRVLATVDDKGLTAQLEAIDQLRFARVGEDIAVDLIAIDGQAATEKQFGQVVAAVADHTSIPLVLLCDNSNSLKTALASLTGKRPLIGPATEQNWEAIARIATEQRLPVLVRSSSLEGLASLAETLTQKGIEDLVLCPQTTCLSSTLAQLTQLRRLAVEKRFRPLGYPVCVSAGGDTPAVQSLAASAAVCRYADLVITDLTEPADILPVLTTRQNIYTDPTVPNAIEAKLYEIGNPGRAAPVLFTTNFALTYFTVAAEVENSRVPAFITVMDTEGLGVLNAYADDKLTGETIVGAIEAQGAMDRVNHGQLIIPGLIAILQPEIEQASDWDVIVGPEDAAGIPRFLRAGWNSGSQGP